MLGSIAVIVGALALIYHIATRDSRAMAGAAKMICRNCGVVSHGKMASRSNGWIFLILLFFMVIPAIIYALATSKKFKVCPSCGSPDIVPVTSPVGRELCNRLHQVEQSQV